MIVGLCGSHRSGKSTLARAYAEKHGVKFLETSASAVFKELGYDPAVTYGFETRMEIQEVMLRRFDDFYATAKLGELSIVDRTPLDMLAYTLGDISGDTLTENMEARVAKYVHDCFGVINKRFSVLLVVQPGIKVVPAEGKASLSPGYIEHVSSLIMGLSVDERVAPPHYYIPRNMTDLPERVAALDYAINRVKTRAALERQETGATLH